MNKEKIYLSILWNCLPEILEEYSEFECNYEISFTLNELLNRSSGLETKIKDIFDRAEKQVFIHAPYTGLSYGTVGYADIDRSREALFNLADIGNFMEADKFIFHLLLPGPDDKFDRWLTESMKTIEQFTDRINSKSKICFENVFEQDTGIFENVFSSFSKLSERVFRCFDIGHAVIMLGEDGIYKWLDSISINEIDHVHLHDNHGKIDEHLPLGMGSIDFPGIIRYFREKGIDPTYTIENFDKETLQISLEYLRTNL